ncbi:putative ABC transporter ATP-binding protein [Gordonia rhizosphera NBRC 16068]|uniref:Putative ABC transporter ATP-binding protein n=2 Tax=Gordonia rhizosphera TaxID=83341 RepID=K6WC67_9ACTN|nr:putative ABC transporter ATP-binding protein [Gordonia rhizosphera NBRC 16068]
MERMRTSPSSSAVSPALSVHNLSKTFAGQRALDDVTFDLHRGKITALLGMNGSGKSTLIKILAGVYQPDPGATIEVSGDSLALPVSPGAAHRAGLRFLHQDVGLVDALTIADNFAFVDRFRRNAFGRINRKAQYRHVSRTLEHFGIDERPDRLVSELDPTTRTMIGIARAFQDEEEAGEAAFARNILILDEPTASLPAGEVDRVLDILRTLRSHGGTAIYVSHRIDEVRQIADRMVILRDGKLVDDKDLGALTESQIVDDIVGQKLEKVQLRGAAEREGDIVLKVRGLRGPRLAGLDLDLRSGEVLGIAGLVGCGRSEMVRILAGAQRRSAGVVEVGGREHSAADPASAITAGVACVPQNRRVDGCVLPMTVGENLTLGRLREFTNRAATVRSGTELADSLAKVAAYNIKPPSLSKPIATLSGGNQQKVVVARAASHRPAVLLLDEPTQGVDALAKQEIWNLVRQLADSGTGVILASTDFSELETLADRVIVLDRGRQVAEVTGDDINESQLAALSSSGSSPAPSTPEHAGLKAPA